MYSPIDMATYYTLISGLISLWEFQSVKKVVATSDIRINPAERWAILQQELRHQPQYCEQTLSPSTYVFLISRVETKVHWTLEQRFSGYDFLIGLQSCYSALALSGNAVLMHLVTTTLSRSRVISCRQCDMHAKTM